MIATLVRSRFVDAGIFGELRFDGAHVAVTLEHSYDDQPKLPDGSYQCVRGMHRLDGMDHDFETFEITGVPGHTGILLHWGNYNSSSAGCVLVGESATDSMITNSRKTFQAIMDRLAGIDQFTLTVTSHSDGPAS